MKWATLFTSSVLLVLFGAHSSAEPGALPRTVVIRDHDEPLWVAPARDVKRRGAALQGARLPVYEARVGPGCKGRWFNVGQGAWLCEERVESSNRAPTLDRGLPALRHFFVGPHGSLGYANLETAEQVPPDFEYDPGFAVALQGLTSHSGERFGQTHRGYFVPLRDLVPAADPEANGSELDGTLRVAWVYKEHARVYSDADVRRKTARTLPKAAVLRIVATRAGFGGTFHRVGDDVWVRADDVRRPRPAAVPKELAAGERWIDVDTTEQVLTAYEGIRPVFAALVSTGKGAQGSPFRTPKGSFRIWIKLHTSDMSNVEDDDSSGYYSIEAVPWVMYFLRGYGLHGAFWHRSFGRERSHGCVNLTPADAAWLFRWTKPELPPGWTAILATDHDPGTLVRVR